MVKAARQAKQATNNTAREHYEAFLFKHANTLLHEIGHVFITYLSKGGQLTPPTIIAQTSYKSNPDKGEAGRKLEALVFGGTIEYWEYPDAETRDDAVSSLMVAPVQGNLLESKLMHTPVRRALPVWYDLPLEDSAGDNQENCQLR